MGTRSLSSKTLGVCNHILNIEVGKNLSGEPMGGRFCFRALSRFVLIIGTVDVLDLVKNIRHTKIYVNRI